MKIAFFILVLVLPLSRAQAQNPTAKPRGAVAFQAATPAPQVGLLAATDPQEPVTEAPVKAVPQTARKRKPAHVDETGAVEPAAEARPARGARPERSARGPRRGAEAGQSARGAASGRAARAGRGRGN